MSLKTIDCPTCRLTHLDPLPSEETLDDLAQRMHSELRPSYHKDKDEDMPWHRSVWSHLLKRIAKAAPERSLMDVGSGLGHFVREAQLKDWKAYGLDPCADAVRLSKQQGVETIQGTIEGLEEGRQFGAITMFNVLEHLLSPQVALRKCHSLLVDDGVLYVSVPNDYNWMQKRLEQKHGPWWVSPLHVSYFNDASLRRLAEASGFDVLWSSTSFPMEVFALLGLGYQSRPKLGRRLHRLRTWMDRAGFQHAYPLLAKLGTGRHVNLLLRKRKDASLEAGLLPPCQQQLETAA